jgi:L-ascorbate metabolism protein UlaG (beta-lactamase superfamily)
MIIKFVGHATFLITLSDGTVILFDPWFGGGGFGTHRMIQPALKQESLSRCDVILASHAHDDHFDNEAIKLAKRLNSTIIGPSEVGSKAERGGVSKEKIRILDEKDDCEINGLNIHGVPAYHPGEALGIILETDDGVIYHSGDTILFDELINTLSDYKIDVALVTIGGLKIVFRKLMMDYMDAAKLVAEIKPKFAVPMHYRTFRGINVDPMKFQGAVKAEDPDIDVIILNPGKSFVL